MSKNKKSTISTKEKKNVSVRGKKIITATRHEMTYRKNKDHFRYNVRFDNFELKSYIESYFEKINLKIEDFSSVIYYLGLVPKCTTVRYHELYENVVQLLTPSFTFNLEFISYEDRNSLFFSLRQIKESTSQIYCVKNIDFKPILSLISEVTPKLRCSDLDVILHFKSWLEGIGLNFQSLSSILKYVLDTKKLSGTLKSHPEILNSYIFTSRNDEYSISIDSFPEENQLSLNIRNMKFCVIDKFIIENIDSKPFCTKLVYEYDDSIII